MVAKVRILFFASNPKDMIPLALDEEIRSISTKIRASEHRDVLDLVSRWAVRPDDLLQELNALEPTVVHFSGHGNSAGELVLMDDLRQPIAVSPLALEALFSILRNNIRLVVLNACYSKTQATAIARAIDCVIGMNDRLGDKAAIIFAASFYRAIGFGWSVKESFDQGKVALLLEGIPQENIPELLVRSGVDPASVYLVSSDIGKSEAKSFKSRLRLSLRDTDSTGCAAGQWTRWGGGDYTYFYHLIVQNWGNASARDLWVELKAVSKPGKDGTYRNTLSRRLPLRKPNDSDEPSPGQVREQDYVTWNFGYLAKHLNQFQLDIYQRDWPPLFQGIVRAGERLRIEVLALAENARSEPLCLEVSWDGEWIDDDPDAMKHHLRVCEVAC